MAENIGRYCVGVIIGILNFIIFRAIEYVYISNDLIGEDNLPLWQVSNYFMALEVLFIVTYIAGIILLSSYGGKEVGDEKVNLSLNYALAFCWMLISQRRH